MTVALLLALQGRTVLLLEKGPRPGGAMARFRRNGVPFDVGFHFTGGLYADRHGMLDEMLTVLGVRDCIVPVFLPQDQTHRVVIESDDVSFAIPNGIDACQSALRGRFPGEGTAIDAYFKRFLAVCAQTASMSLTGLGTSPELTEHDYVTLQDVLDELTPNRLLHAALSGYAMCYGSSPAEISFANHCRMCFGLHDSIAWVRHGGDAFVDALVPALAAANVELRCGTTIREMLDVRDRTVERFLLSDGAEVSCASCVLTIHPMHILDLLPQGHLTPAFRDRVRGFRPSLGFFAVFGTVADGGNVGADEPILSLFPNADMNRLLEPDGESDAALVLLRRRVRAGARTVSTITVLEAAAAANVAAWRDTRVGARPAAYYEYKAGRAARLLERVARYAPECRNGWQEMATASMLTFRDYLNTPDGAAYGIRQMVGQFNLVGKLPLRNLYAAGQSAILPGVVGAMTSAFFVARALVGKQGFCRFVERRLCL